MNDKLPSREQALKFLRESGCSRNVIKHCKTVAKLAVEISKSVEEKGMKIDLQLVEIGALLHDIGRSKTHSIHHAVAGVKIAESFGFSKKIVSIIKRHVGGGITAKTAKQLGWPKDVYIPQTLEEKIVAYADKLVEGSNRVPIEKTIEKFRSDMLPPSAIARLERLHEEMLDLVGDCKCLS